MYLWQKKNNNYWSATLQEMLSVSQNEIHFIKKKVYRFFQANSNFEGSTS